MMRTASPLISILFGLIGATLSCAAFAHHSAAAIDRSKSLELKGTVTKWEFTNPHSWLYVKVKNADGSEAEYALELGSPSIIVKAGFTRKGIVPGDQVTVTFNPHRAIEHEGYLVSVLLPNGKTLRAGGPPVPGAPPPGY